MTGSAVLLRRGWRALLAFGALATVAAACDVANWTPTPVSFDVPAAPSVTVGNSTTTTTTTTTTVAPPACTLSGPGGPLFDVNATDVGVGFTGRTFRMGTPNSACTAANPTGAKVPLIIALHGGAETSSFMAGYSDLYARGNTGTDDYAVIFPQAVDKGVMTTWNDGRSGITTQPATGVNPDVTDVNDVGYINALIDWAISTGAVNPNKVYVTGFSNGAFMANRLACESSSKLAAAVFVAGYAPLDPIAAYCPSGGASLPVLLISSDAESVVPFAGGQIGCGTVCPRGRTVSASAFMTTWRTRNGCTGSPTQEALATNVGGPGTRFVSACTKATVQDVLHDTNHEYYGGSVSAEQTYNAAVRTWAFLKQFTR
ncbi:MAG: PHB depolymerase family esterase [Acidimicrobiia bacterium]